MNEKDKAKELVYKFISSERVCDCWCECTVIACDCSVKQRELDSAKQCTLICVDEILEVLNPLTLEYEYWEQVKHEIEKL